MNFDTPLQGLIVTGRMTETVNVFGMQVQFKMLNSGQRRDVLGETGGLDTLTRGHQIQICTLARAIISIDGAQLQYIAQGKDDPITPEKTVNQNKEYLEQVQQPVLDHLYEKYAKLSNRQEEHINELKKKSLKVGQEPSGPSEKPPALPAS